MLFVVLGKSLKQSPSDVQMTLLLEHVGPVALESLSVLSGKIFL
jgi:hypothetical protein